MSSLVLIAPPGGGKGTLTSNLINKYPYKVISTGDVLRDAAKTNKDIASKLSKGELIDDELLFSLIENKIEKGSNYIFDGIPRTLNQAVKLHSILDNYKVIYFKVDYDTLLKRIVGRRICPNCHTIYNIYTDKVKESCPKCNTKLSTRTDDNEETFKKRYEIYEENTKDIIDYYKKMDNLYIIKGDTPEDYLKETERLEGLND